MAKKLLIDGAYPEEARVVILDNQKIDDWDYKTTAKKLLKGNIYLGKITRIESSLQAAFVDFGDDKQGFLPFSEIHPDYYHIPVSDRPATTEEVSAAEGAVEPALPTEAEAEALSEKNEDLTAISSLPNLAPPPPMDWTEEPSVETVEPAIEAETPAVAAELSAEGEMPPSEAVEPQEAAEDIAESDEDIAEMRHTVAPLYKRYKIQEVIRRNQIILVQVTKEERGNKGASLTSYISLAGRYSVLMPNSDRQGGISRRIAESDDRKRLRQIVDSLGLTDGTSIIIRTAGSHCTKEDIYRDYDYLVRLWNSIRDNTLKSKAPCFIHAEGDLIKRAIRDMYTSGIEEIIVQGDQAYKEVQSFLKMLIPSHSQKVKHYKQRVPLFQRYRVEEQLARLYQHTVSLESGGYIVINPTEALVSIDVNSGRSTSERNVEETAVKTNLEAAHEIAKQLRLRDLAGIVVIDFIDMLETKHRIQVERALRESLGRDRAKIQLGRISSFGLLEMSRQRLRPNVFEANNHVCAVCEGKGMIRAPESLAMTILRAIEAEVAQGSDGSMVTVQASAEMVLFLLNQKRQELVALEERYRTTIQFVQHHQPMTDYYTIQKTKQSQKKTQSLTQLEIYDDLPEYQPAAEAPEDAPSAPAPERSRGGGRRGRRNWHKNEGAAEQPKEAAAEAPIAEEGQPRTEPAGEDTEKRSSNRRRPRRRGGRNRRDRQEGSAPSATDHANVPEGRPSGEAPSRAPRSRKEKEYQHASGHDAHEGEPSILKGLWKRIMDH